jgi:prepilin peptidase CpaA
MAHGWLALIAPASLFAGAGLLLLAALHDIVARTVPNGVSVLLALMGLGARIMDSNVLVGAAAAAAVFFVAAFLWRRGWMGGGDVKLIGAAALLLPPYHVVPFIVAMSISGSILAALYLAAGHVARRNKPSQDGHAIRPAGLLPRAVRVELWRMRRGGPLPYACAIAAGFLFVQF